jgi:hypothetical protein
MDEQRLEFTQHGDGVANDMAEHEFVACVMSKYRKEPTFQVLERS